MMSCGARGPREGISECCAFRIATMEKGRGVESIIESSSLLGGLPIPQTCIYQCSISNPRETQRGLLNGQWSVILIIGQKSGIQV